MMKKFLLIILFAYSCNYEAKKYTGTFRKKGNESFGRDITIKYYKEDTFLISDTKNLGTSPGVRRGNRIIQSIGEELKEFGVPKTMKIFYDFHPGYNMIIRTSNQFPGIDTFIRIR